MVIVIIPIINGFFYLKIDPFSRFIARLLNFPLCRINNYTGELLLMI